MKLHVFPPSPRAAKVTALAYHLDLGSEIQLVDLFNGGQLTPEFAALNPNKRMPVLEDDGFVLWESNAILQYLAAKKPESGLWPQDLRAQAEVTRWMTWEAAHWMPVCALFAFERVVKKLSGAGEPDEAQIAKGEAEFPKWASVLNGHLAGRKWLLGDRLTIADFCVGAPMIMAQAGRYPLSGFDEIPRWYAQLAALPAWQKAAVAPPA